LRAVTTSTKREAKSSMRKPSRTSTVSMAHQSPWGKQSAQAVLPRMRITTIAAVAAAVRVVEVVVAADLAPAEARAKSLSICRHQKGPDNLSGPFWCQC
jgi:hypothetical protein